MCAVFCIHGTSELRDDGQLYSLDCQKWFLDLENTKVAVHTRLFRLGVVRQTLPHAVNASSVLFLGQAALFVAQFASAGTRIILLDPLRWFYWRLFFCGLAALQFFLFGNHWIGAGILTAVALGIRPNGRRRLGKRIGSNAVVMIIVVVAHQQVRSGRRFGTAVFDGKGRQTGGKDGNVPSFGTKLSDSIVSNKQPERPWPCLTDTVARPPLARGCHPIRHHDASFPHKW